MLECCYIERGLLKTALTYRLAQFMISLAWDLTLMAKTNSVLSFFSHPGEFKRDLDEYLSYGVITRDN